MTLHASKDGEVFVDFGLQTNWSSLVGQRERAVLEHNQKALGRPLAVVVAGLLVKRAVRLERHDRVSRRIFVVDVPVPNQQSTI